ncbi:MAG TPA: GNAT family N-acyltransferase [Tepidisphaeraceae bacterium]|nr:GNAT family N-acyltransferase [Tepidisphaeraceae bacterium]
MALEIRTVIDESERHRVFRFRYRVYVEEMGLNIAEADHKRRWVHDHVDEHAIILAAFDGETIHGTVCLNFAAVGLGRHEETLRLRELKPYFPNHVSTTTRLIVSKQYRNGTLGTRLAKAGFRIYLAHGMLFDIICCHPRQRAYFENLGYRRLLPDLELEGYGSSHVMVLALADKDHLCAIRSPFSSFLAELPSNRDSVEFLEHLLAVKQDRDAACSPLT